MDPSFEVLLRKSIFARDRSRPDRPTGPPSTGNARTLSPEQSVVFRGVLCPDEEYVAFMENIQTGQITIVKTGDELLRGRVAGITLDALTYDSGGRVHTIHLGQDLTGEIASGSGSSFSPGTTSGPSTATPGAAAAPVSADQQAIIERLKQKRAAEERR